MKKLTINIKSILVDKNTISPCPISYGIQKTLTTFIFFFMVTVPYALAAGLENPLENSGIYSFEKFVELLLKAVINIGLPIAVLSIVYSGFLFVTAQGNVTKIEEAKKTFYYTIIGVALFLGSWTLAIIVRNTIGLLTG